MLSSLHIKDLALIDDLDIDFQEGLNVITGPTGAGKSIIVGGLEFVLGGRASGVMLRTGKSVAVVEAVFRITPSRSLRALAESSAVALLDGSLTLRREYRKQGAGRASVNDTPVPVSTLRNFADHLASILGQHAHQSLLDQTTHREYLDRYAGLENKLGRLKELYEATVDLKERMEYADKHAREISERIDLLKFQIDDIEKANLKPDEEEDLKQEKVIQENCLRIREAGEMAGNALLESDGSILEKLGEIEKTLNGIPGVGSTWQNIVGLINNASGYLNEAVSEIRNLIGRIEDDPERLEEINERLQVITRLKRKYGDDIREILRYGDDSRRKLDDLNNRTGKTDDLQRDFAATLAELHRLSTEISEARGKARSGLERSICMNLESMGMQKAQFVVNVYTTENADGLYFRNGQRLDGDSSGFDKVEFQFCANPGEGLKPLVRVASGGEISRLMLALKNALLRDESSGCEVFDEIDVGISGQVADRVAAQLKKLSQKQQVICITHLQQIASAADHHYRVYKLRIGGRQVTRIEKLGPEERVKEIASLLSGAEITDTALAGAREMLKNSRPRR